MSDGAILEYRAVGKTFQLRDGRGAGLRAVDGVNLTVGRGRIVGLVGESGCGKSTLAKLAVRLEEPSEGEIRFAGRDITTLRGDDLAAYRQRAQLVFQDPYAALPPRMTVGDAIAEPLRIFRRGDAAARRARVAELLGLVGLPAASGARYPHQLSGGQRQRVNIARALALQPDLLILDEPVSALDVSVQAQVLNLLRQLQRQFGLAYLFISHDLRVVRYLCDEVAVMYLGRVIEQGPAAEVFSAPRHPYTLALLRSIPDRVSGGGRRALLRGEVPSPIDVPPGCAFHPRCSMAQAICRTERPPLRPVAGGHLSACHFAERVGQPGEPMAEAGASAGADAAR